MTAQVRAVLCPSAAEFISRVAEHCFGKWAWFEPTYDVLGNPTGWTVRTPIVSIEMCDGVRIHNHLGFGPKKLAALLDALETNEPKEVQK